MILCVTSLPFNNFFLNPSSCLLQALRLPGLSGGGLLSSLLGLCIALHMCVLSGFPGMVESSDSTQRPHSVQLLDACSCSCHTRLRLLLVTALECVDSCHNAQ